MRTSARHTLAAIIFALLALLVASPAAAAPLYPPTDPDPFYAAPAELSQAAPGDVLKIRPRPIPPGFTGVETWQIQFRSTDSAGAPIAATTTLFLPHNRIDNGPLLSFQHIINALGLQCTPSRALYTNDPLDVIREAPALNAAFQQGWSVAVPDHLGPKSAYGAARLGGTIALDGIRAVQRATQFQLAESPVTMAGYSGGGMATAFAAALAPSYAPELDIIGAAAGGVPMDLRDLANALGDDPHPAFGLAFAAALGLEREYPERFPVSTQLTASGRALQHQLNDGCTNDILGVGINRGIRDIAVDPDLVDSPEAIAVIEENSVSSYPGVPTAPMFIWHSSTDLLVPIDAVDRTVARYCAAGATVALHRVNSPDHLTAALEGLPAAVEYLRARYRGEPAPSTC
ncbi:lipase [Hoyosella sp. G463]|uniref:Lipase n=1 Tax=Lolliginicoccus lacisalsi TaxID=2742202 RepID=A0A927J9L9_9ACTN|nr:lipase family protein [Lolliginicoccus lacisalsi]MBD8505124.1 lipase [Lolliginicoccus lacisalsi]